MIVILLIGVVILSFFDCCKVEATRYEYIGVAHFDEDGELVVQDSEYEKEVKRWEYTEKYNVLFFAIVTIIEIFFVIGALKKRYIVLALLIDCAKMGIPCWVYFINEIVGNLFSMVDKTYEFTFSFFILIAFEFAIAILYIFEFDSMRVRELKNNTIAEVN